jgi:TonB family protein
MAETVLVIEYEPRYIERLREAFAGTPVKLSFARDGREALEALKQSRPSAVILSWILPKTDVTQLIASIHESGDPRIPILLTVSGYSGRDSHADARRVGAEDLLAKPFSQADLIARVEALLGHPIERDSPLETGTSPGFHPAAAHAVAAGENDRIGSEEIFGELTDAEPETVDRSAAEGVDTAAKADDLDALLDQTLISLRKKKSPGPAAKGEQLSELDRLVEDTLSGLRRKSPPPPRPPVAEVQAPALEPEAPAPEPDPFPGPDRGAEAPAGEMESVLAEGDETHTARPGARFGQFVLRERIATGGMAEIWQAQMQGVEGFEKLVAIKRILPHLAADKEFVDMFIDEAKIAARLSHPNIIHIYDLGKAADTYYIAMELVAGHDLKSILRRASERDFPMDPSLAIFVASRVAAALDYAHRKEPGLVHRDVSPQNVLISWDGDIKLCDFGIAKATSKVSHTQSGALKGKLQYMSPEQASGSSLDGRSDIFSLGVVLYEMLTGRKLFRGESEISVIDQVRDAKVEAPSIENDEVTPEIDRIVLKALAREPGQRYETAAEMARDLEHVLYGFKPTPSVADLAVWMHRIWAAAPLSQDTVAESEIEDPEEDPKVITLVAPPPEPEPVVETPLAPPIAAADLHQPEAAPGERHVAPPFSSSAAPTEPKRSRAALWVALLALALGAGGFAAWRFVGPSRSENAVQAAAVTGSPARQTAATPPSAPQPGDAADTASVPGDGFPEVEIAPAISPGDVDLEVRRRLEAERERLERLRQQELARSQQQPTAPQPQAAKTTTQPPTATAAPVTQTVAPEPQAPPPPEPSPAQTAPAEAVATTTRPAAPSYRAGDLVPHGTPGLVEPSLISLRKVNYPPMAKARKVQGIVVLRALVTEAGTVAQVEVLRSPSPDFGIAAAARDAVEGAKFTPATYEGNAVRTWKTLTVPFTL